MRAVRKDSSLEEIIIKHHLSKIDENAQLTAKDERDNQKELQKMMDNLNSKNSYAAFDGMDINEIDEED